MQEVIENEYPEDDAVIGKGPEIVVRDVTEQSLDRHQGTEEGDNKADGNGDEVLPSQMLPGFENIVAGGQKHGGNGEKKREFCGRLPRQAGKQAADDGGTGAGGAGYEGANLKKAEFQGVTPVHFVDTGDARLPLAAFNQKNDQATDDKGAGHHNWVEQVGLDGFVQQQAENGGRQHADDQVEDKTPGARLAGQAGNHPDQPHPVMPADRENRAELDADLEGFCLFPGVGEQIPGNDQMPC